MKDNYTKENKIVLEISSPFGTMKVEEFAKSIGIAKSTAYDWLNSYIPKNCYKKIGRTIFINVKNMQEFFAN